MTTDPRDAFGEAQRRIGDLREQARINAERTASLSDLTQTIIATAVSPGREIQVTARVGGVIDELTFTEAADTLPRSELAALTRRTITIAQHQAMRELARRGTDLFGGDSPIVHQLWSDADRAFPHPDGS